MVDGITPHKSPLFKRGRNVVVEVILPHFRVRPFCVVVSSSLWNPEVLGSNLGTNSVLGTSRLTHTDEKITFQQTICADSEDLTL